MPIVAVQPKNALNVFSKLLMDSWLQPSVDSEVFYPHVAVFEFKRHFILTLMLMSELSIECEIEPANERDSGHRPNSRNKYFPHWNANHLHFDVVAIAQRTNCERNSIENGRMQQTKITIDCAQDVGTVLQFGRKHSGKTLLGTCACFSLSLKIYGERLADMKECIFVHWKFGVFRFSRSVVLGVFVWN